MPLFDETGRESFGKFYARVDPLAPSLSTVLTGDPLSANFKVPAGDTPRDLVRYLIACQVREIGTTICLTSKINEGALVRQAKKLLTQHDPETIKRGIKLASLWSPFPFSFKYVRERTIPEVITRMERGEPDV